ncbi:MAG TPA: hypothetical protein VF148_04690 [Acidimicrobiia bacterium]
MPSLESDRTMEPVLAWEPVIRRIEEQRPRPVPAMSITFTYGWLVGEVIRRITGMTPGEFFRSTIGNALGLRT